MRRREFVFGLVSLVGAGEGRADDRSRMLGALVTAQTQKQVLQSVLKERGWNVGQNLLIEYRISGDDTEEKPDVRARVDCLEARCVVRLNEYIDGGAARRRLYHPDGVRYGNRPGHNALR